MVRPTFLAACVLALPAFAADPRGDAPDAPASTAQEQLAKFHVPPGFEVQLVADETQIQKPMNLAFDAAGRLWVTGSELYPWAAKVDALGQPIAGFNKVWASTAGAFDADKAPPPPERATDTVRVLSDFGPDGRARKVQIFADGLNIPIGLQPLPRGSAAITGVVEPPPQFDPNPAEPKPAPVGDRHVATKPKGDSVIVYSIPAIWMLTDWDGDGKADQRVPLYTGFDFKDTHGMSSNYYYWIDGWIYGCHGFRNRSEVRDRNGKVTIFESGNTYRFRPDGSAIEPWSYGQTNPFGLAFDEFGNLYSADSHSKPVMLLLRGGYYEGIGKQHDGLGFAPRITDDDHGSSGIAGLAYYADDKFPAAYRGNLFTGNPVTRRINRAKLEWHGSTPKAVRQEDFLTCDDPWFRPVQVKLGPDGALWIADFYNPIIGHYEVPLSDPRRDRTRGRIWRVVWKGESAPANSLPDLTALDAAGLVEKLADPNLIVRVLVSNELADRTGYRRPDGEYLVGLGAKVGPTAQRAFAIGTWSRKCDASEVSSAQLQLRADEMEPLVSVHAQHLDAELKTWGSHLKSVAVMGLGSQDARVRRAAARALATHPAATHLSLLLAAHEAAAQNDVQLRYALEVALRDQFAEAPRTEAEFSAQGRWQSLSFGSDQGDSYLAPAIWQEADRLAHASFSHATILANTCLAVKSAEAAEFLLGELKRTHFATPRAGEYLKHAALHIPAERIGEVVALLPELDEASTAQRMTVADGLAQAGRERKLKLPPKATAWVEKVTLEALGSEDTATLESAIASARAMKGDARIEPLLDVLADETRPGRLRAAALDALAATPGIWRHAARVLGDPASGVLRRKAVEVLARQLEKDLQSPREEKLVRPDRALPALLSALPTAPTDLAVAIATALVNRDETAGLLLSAIEAGQAPATLLQQKAVAAPLAQVSARSLDLEVRTAILTADLPPEDARLDRLITDRLYAYREAKPDTAKGAQVFAQHCAVCHRFRNAGGNVGPNLDGMAARGPHRLIEDILDPNRNVDPAFRQTMIETQDGQTFAGANLREQSETVRLSDATGQEVSVAKSAIKTQTQSRLSLMPAIFDTQLPEADFQALLAYLLDAAK